MVGMMHRDSRPLLALENNFSQSSKIMRATRSLFKLRILKIMRMCTFKINKRTLRLKKIIIPTKISVEFLYIRHIQFLNMYIHKTVHYANLQRDATVGVMRYGKRSGSDEMGMLRFGKRGGGSEEVGMLRFG